MPTFSIEGTTVKVRDGSGQLSHDQIDRQRRAFSGKMRSETSGNGRVMRRWRIDTDWLTDTEADALIADLAAPGFVDAAGDLIGGTVSCKAENIQRRDGPGPDQSHLSFTLLEVS